MINVGLELIQKDNPELRTQYISIKVESPRRVPVFGASANNAKETTRILKSK